MQHIYYVTDSSESEGSRTVHTALCHYVNASTRKQYLGVFSGCLEAVREARRIYPNVKGCVYCCRLE